MLIFEVNSDIMQKSIRKLFTTLILIVIGGTLLPQSNYQKDTALINYYSKQAYKNWFGSIDSLHIYLDSMENILSGINYPKGKANYYNLKGQIAFRQGLYDSVKRCYYKSIKYARQTDDSILYIKYKGNLGMIYNKLRELDSAEIILKQNVKLLKKSRFSHLYAKAALDLSQTYMMQKEWNKSLKYALISDSISESLKDTIPLIYCLNTLASCYTKIEQYDKTIESYHKGMQLARLKLPAILASFYLNIGDFYTRFDVHIDSAIYYLNKSIELSKKNHYPFHLYASELNISGIYLLTKEYDKCINILRKYWDIDSPELQTGALINAGLAMIETGNDSARLLLNRGLEISEENNLLENLKNAYNGLSRLDSLKGNYLEAYTYHLKYDSIHDSLYNRELRETAASFEVKSRLEKDEIEKQGFKRIIGLQNKIIDQKSSLNTVFFISILLAVIFLVVLLFLRKKRNQLYNELQQKNKELNSLNEVKLTLFSILSHDLRSYLGSSNQLAHVFYEQFDTFTDTERKKYLKSLVNSSDAVYTLMDNLLSWTRLQNEDPEYKQQQFKLSPIISKSIELSTPMANQKNIVIENKITNGTVVLGNEKVVSVILRNLLTNAIKFTPEHGRISVTGSVNNKFYQVCVEDNGIGIKKEIIDKLFDFNSQYRQSGTGKEGGSGFGLKLIKLMLNKIGGTIWVESTVGVGSKFYITLKLIS